MALKLIDRVAYQWPAQPSSTQSSDAMVKKMKHIINHFQVQNLMRSLHIE